MTAQLNQHMVWRLMNRGDLVAQVTVAPWTKRDAGKKMSFDDFQGVIDSTPAWKEARCLDKQDMLTYGGNSAFRYWASGKLDGNDVLQYYYLVASPRGDQLFVTFTLSPSQAKEFKERNEAFVQGISFPIIESGK